MPQIDLSCKHRKLLLILAAGLVFKAVLLACDVVPFNADEAVVALMARHILNGERPWFFYGQAYMGSLDAYLIAGAFSVLGESVMAVRIVQAALFAATLVTGYLVALRFTGGRRLAALTTLLMAIPPVLLTLYTTASLGGYGEALLAGHLLLWWGHRLGWEDGHRRALWFAWGAVAGVGFWAFGLVLVYLVPVALWLAWRWFEDRRARPWWGYLLAAGGFVLGSLPWWIGNLGQVDVGVAELLGSAISSTNTAGTFWLNVGQRVFSFFIFGLPALFGLRFPWRVGGGPLWMAVPALALYLGALVWALKRRKRNQRVGSGYLLLWLVCGCLFLGFVLTPFGGDPSGRYFVPLYLPLFIFTADLLATVRRQAPGLAVGVLGAVLIFNLVSTLQAATVYPPGITTQFDAVTQVDHRSMEQLIDFLLAHDGTRGYTNYWVAYPTAFLSQEKVILIPRLPYKEDLRYTSRDDRYAPYGRWVERSPTVVYVTTNHPLLDRLLREQFTDLQVSFAEAQIGDYHVFYDLSRPVRPEELRIYKDAGQE